MFFLKHNANDFDPLYNNLCVNACSLQILSKCYIPLEDKLISKDVKPKLNFFKNISKLSKVVRDVFSKNFAR